MATQTQDLQTVDLTPTWESLVHLLMYLAQGDNEQRDTAHTELRKMGRAADKWNAHVKAASRNRDNVARLLYQRLGAGLLTWEQLTPSIRDGWLSVAGEVLEELRND